MYNIGGQRDRADVRLLELNFSTLLVRLRFVLRSACFATHLGLSLGIIGFEVSALVLVFFLARPGCFFHLAPIILAVSFCASSVMVSQTRSMPTGST